MPVGPRRAKQVVERRGCKRAADDPRGRISRPHQGGAVLVAVFDCPEPEQRLVRHRPTDAKGNLLAIEGRVVAGRPVIGRRQCLPAAVACECRRRSAQRLTSGPCHDINRGRSRPSCFRAEPVRGNLEFLHRLLRHVLQRPADHIVIVVSAVDGDVPSASELAGRGDRHRVRLGRVEVGRGGVARHQQGKFEEVAAVQRQRVDHGRSDDGVHDGPAFVDRRQPDGSRHDDRFPHRRDRQFN